MSSIRILYSFIPFKEAALFVLVRQLFFPFWAISIHRTRQFSTVTMLPTHTMSDYYAPWCANYNTSKNVVQV